MQTLRVENHRVFTHIRRWASAAAVLALTLTAGACTMPRIQGRAESEYEPSACEQALYTAMDADETMRSPLPLPMRYDAARTARDSWLDAAVSCPARFGEVVMRAAQSAARADTMAAYFGLTQDDAGWDEAGVTSLDIDRHRSALDDLVDTAAAADAEDVAGFAFEVLAARQVAGATLQQGDRCKAAAQMLASLGQDDARQGVYDPTPLLDHPDRMTDTVTGLSAPTTAVVLMDCARSLIAAAHDTCADQTSQTEPTPTDEAWRAYAVQAANHALQAFRLGYPMIDEALFDAEATTNRNAG